MRLQKMIYFFVIFFGLFHFMSVLAVAATPVVAIDVALIPDDNMAKNAVAINADLRQHYHENFPLNLNHIPHITLLQRYVRVADLDKIYAAVENIVSKENKKNFFLKAINYFYLPYKGVFSFVIHVGLLGFTVEPTPPLYLLQDKLIMALTPYAVSIGDAQAFIPNVKGRDILPQTIQYVAEFVPKHSGSNYQPHLTLGISTKRYFEQLNAKPFVPIEFGAKGLGIFRLGNFGTAESTLKEWKFLNTKNQH